jgi:putative ATP-dependent endonuclease of OLD family
VKVKKMRVQNYRSYRDSGEVSVGDKLVLVGENNAGKSNILRAMEMFLDISPTSPHQLEDFHLKDPEQDIEIGVWFTDFSAEEREVFEEYMLDDTLYVRTIYPFDEDTESVENKYFVVEKRAPAVEEFRNIADEGADRVAEIYDEYEDRLQPYQIDDWTDNKYKNEIVPTVEDYLSSALSS